MSHSMIAIELSFRRAGRIVILPPPSEPAICARPDRAERLQSQQDTLRRKVVILDHDLGDGHLRNRIGHNYDSARSA